MTRTFAKIVVAGVLTALPIAAVSLPPCAIAGSGGAPVVLPVPLPADPQTDPPAPAPAPASHGEYYNPNDHEDWWYYGGAGG